MKVVTVALLLALTVGGCATNPVTGESELALVSESTELEIGSKQYAPSRQMQGGDYLLDPALTAYVRDVGRRLAAVSDRKLPYEFSVINDSSPNAWALPGGKIAVNRGLLVELQSEAELAAVLGHEIVHAAARHSAQGMERGMLLQGALAAVGAVARNSEYAGVAVGAASLGANLLNQRYSREAELESDRYGMLYMQRAGYDPMAAVDLQQTFVRLDQSRQQNWLTGLFASHPPSPERVEANRGTARRMGRGGRVGRQEYERMIAGLKRSRPAYEAFDEGQKQLEKSPEAALRLAEKAISIERREGLFHGLKGDALYQMKQYEWARKAYDSAVALNPDFFRPHLQRAMVRSRLNDQRGARQDLQRSLELLPTADAHYLLGILAREEGDRRSAAQHFRTAAGSDSGVGRAAAKALAALSAAVEPARNDRLRADVMVDRSGRLLVRVSNEGSVDIRDPVVVVGRVDARGKIHDGRAHRLQGRLPPGRSFSFDSGIRGLSRSEADNYRAQVVGARTTH
ncbi:MAG: M48 family metalloprotease [Gammaproteobacteria bacterium]|nr:M48 family metalloprotease [Gammaproteobacteria bacterium]